MLRVVTVTVSDDWPGTEESMPVFALVAVIACVVLAVLALVSYVVHMIKPGRFRLSIEGGWKQIKLNVEVDAQDKPKELPLRLTFAQTDMRFLGWIKTDRH
jgi:hypothetical protein